MKQREKPAVSIRLWQETDLPILLQLLGDPVMMKHLGGPESPEKIAERHNRYLDRSNAGNMFAIVLDGKEKGVGSTGYWERLWKGQTVWETGWSVLPEFQTMGIATATARIIVERARTERKHRYLYVYPDAGNASSNAVCRKAGFRLRGETDFEYPPGHHMRCNEWHVDLEVG